MRTDTTSAAPSPPLEPADPWMDDASRELALALAVLRTEDEALRFLRDLCTVREIQEFAQRWRVARLLDAGVPYQGIAARTGASSATISRVGQWLRYGRGGYRLLIDRLERRAARRRGSGS